MTDVLPPASPDWATEFDHTKEDYAADEIGRAHV